MLRRCSLFIHVERFSFIDMVYKRLLNMLWVSPPCAHPVRGVKRLQLWQLSIDEGRERIQIPFFSGPSLARQQNAILIALCPLAGGLIMPAGIVSFHHSYM